MITFFKEAFLDKPTDDKVIIVLATIWFLWLCVCLYRALQGKWPFWPIPDD